MSDAPRVDDKSQSVDLRRWIIGLPKPELHVHLEGTISPALYAQIARRNGLDVSGNPDQLFCCDDFDSFLTAFLRVVRALQKPKDFEEVVRAYLASASVQGITHAEIMWSPATQRKFFPDLDLLATGRAIHVAMTEARGKSGISSLIIIDMVRNLGEADALLDIDLALHLRDYGVVGVGLGGDESRFPARDFQRVYERAKEVGLRRTVHAGEAAGVESIVDAVELLLAERIGHGIAARGHEEITKMLRQKNVTVDACPTSNAITRALPAREKHPLPDWLAAGVSVTLSSDDPAFFATTLVEEYQRASEMPLCRDELATIAKNGFAASFAGGEEKRRWLDAVDDYVARSAIP
ncbi:MAG TPA: adenosine deaminase [Candidatus Eremiobacteraceae bacterium]|nr:adenosine deaminase [Candidatus Eremiobacteraceae bacterium]